jgi:hypothetical protein
MQSCHFSRNCTKIALLKLSNDFIVITNYYENIASLYKTLSLAGGFGTWTRCH